jgi:phage gp36-like protein
MAYCSSDDLLNLIPAAELAQLTSESGDLPDLAVAADAIARAAAEIDAYLRVRYQTPLSPVPPQVRALCLDLALYHLYSRRSVAPLIRRQKYEAGVAFLRQVAAGQAVLAEDGAELPAANREVGEIASGTRLFSRATLADW